MKVVGAGVTADQDGFQLISESMNNFRTLGDQPRAIDETNAVLGTLKARPDADGIIFDKPAVSSWSSRATTVS